MENAIKSFLKGIRDNLPDTARIHPFEEPETIFEPPTDNTMPQCWVLSFPSLDGKGNIPLKGKKFLAQLDYYRKDGDLFTTAKEIDSLLEALEVSETNTKFYLDRLDFDQETPVKLSTLECLYNGTKDLSGLETPDSIRMTLDFEVSYKKT